MEGGIHPYGNTYIPIHHINNYGDNPTGFQVVEQSLAGRGKTDRQVPADKNNHGSNEQRTSWGIPLPILPEQ